jgi:hypothetical protein
MDELTARYQDLLTGSYDCVDRIVLNAYFSMGHNPGGFRVWWRRAHGGSDEHLDKEHLMRMAGRFSRRVHAFSEANDIPLIECDGERKHLLAEEHLRTHAVGTGLFMILVARAPAMVWNVKRSAGGVICNLFTRRSFIKHYSFHIWDPTWGHITIKMAGHPPFDAQVMLNGHEYVTCQAQAAGIGFRKEGNCFTAVPDAAALAEVADTLSLPETVGRLSQVVDRWIYSTCLCFGLNRDEVEATRFVYSYSVYQVEYSRNLLFRDGSEMDTVFNTLVDRTRSRLDVARLKTLFGVRQRPHRRSRMGRELSPREAIVIETPQWDLTLFKLHFGALTLKGYTKGEQVARFEAIVHNTRVLNCGRTLDKFPVIVARLAQMADRFTSMLDCVHIGFLPDGILDELPLASTIGTSRVGGIDLNKARMRNALTAALALAVAPGGFTVTDFTAKVRAMTGQDDAAYTIRQGAYDLRKLRAKHFVAKPGKSRRYEVPGDAARTMAGLTVLRDQVIAPILAGIRAHREDQTPDIRTSVDTDYEQLRSDMLTLLDDLGITAGAPLAA